MSERGGTRTNGSKWDMKIEDQSEISALKSTRLYLKCSNTTATVYWTLRTPNVIKGYTNLTGASSTARHVPNRFPQNSGKKSSTIIFPGSCKWQFFVSGATETSIQRKFLRRPRALPPVCFHSSQTKDGFSHLYWFSGDKRAYKKLVDFVRPLTSTEHAINLVYFVSSDWQYV